MIVFVLYLFFWSWLPSAHSLEFRYHNSVEVEQYLKNTTKMYPSITYLHSIGQSVEGRELWVLVIGQNPNQHRTGIPEFKYVGNMHGNEVVSRVVLLQLIDYLTSRYLSDPLVTRMLNSSRVHILPSMNPDGFESSAPDCINTVGRYNKNGVDLNRNFPDVFQANNVQREKEVKAVMDWLTSETFVLSANLHGGAVVASYPYDNSNGGAEMQGGQSVSPDNDVFIYLAKTYSYNHTSMYKGDPCYGSSGFVDGITNGYSWYALQGGMQDYNYVWAQCFEITLEISCCKFPAVSDLPGLWDANKPALLAYMKQVHLGVKGVVMDSNANPIQNAVVQVNSRSNLNSFKTDRNGEYYRLLLPGTYSITVTFPGHKTVTQTVSVPYGPDKFSALTQNFILVKSDNITNSVLDNSPALLASTVTALTAFSIQRLLVF
ncbi:carboxypeptidase M [Misgurnus anguillicaudatus]|uniref:carboxypeptidase M n=1 Tax=Misgurnus anguillicaudatus TaxID=75329 RepID=UPI0024352B86|nr:carboxypeptidase M [Misgurnus anguillicaudatus]